VLVVAMFLGVVVWFGPSMIEAIVANTKASQAVEKAVALMVEQSRATQEFRRHEHVELNKRFDECKKMGSELAECRRGHR